MFDSHICDHLCNLIKSFYPATWHQHSYTLKDNISCLPWFPRREGGAQAIQEGSEVTILNGLCYSNSAAGQHSLPLLLFFLKALSSEVQLYASTQWHPSEQLSMGPSLTKKALTIAGWSTKAGFHIHVQGRWVHYREILYVCEWGLWKEKWEVNWRHNCENSCAFKCDSWCLNPDKAKLSNIGGCISNIASTFMVFMMYSV